MNPDTRIALATISVDMCFLPAHMDDSLRLLRSVAGITGAKRGCLACTVLRDAVEEDRVRYREEWESEVTFRRHIQSKEFQRVLVAMDMSCEEPQVLVGNLSGTRGMGRLRELRGEQGGVTE